MASRSVRAFTLLELMMTAVIGMLIMASVYYVYSATNRDATAREAASLVSFLNNTADQATAASSSYTITNAAGASNPIGVGDVINAFANLQGNVPIGSDDTGAAIISPYGQAVTISVTSSAGTANDLFTIDMPNVPKNACLQVMERVLGATSVYDMYVNGALVPLDPPPTKDASGNVVAPGRINVRMDLAAPMCVGAAYDTIRFRKIKDINFTTLRRQQLGSTLSATEAAFIDPLYARTTAAMTAREAAQAAFP